jgi:hypothetical protein
MVYLPGLYHAEERTNWRLFHESQPIPHYYGTAVIAPHELIDRAGIQRINSPRVWVVGSTGWGNYEVSVPKEWRVCRSATFPEVFAFQGRIVLTYYATRSDDELSTLNQPCGS